MTNGAPAASPGILQEANSALNFIKDFYLYCYWFAMKNRIIHIAALFFLMLITGVFWGTWFTLTRSIESFSAEEFIHIGQVIISNVAVPMRFIMPLGIILMFLSLWPERQHKTTTYVLGWIGCILTVAVLLITLLVLVPIDNDIKEWTASTIPSGWPDIRDKWSTFHMLRTVASLVSFACFSIFILSGDESAS